VAIARVIRDEHNRRTQAGGQCPPYVGSEWCLAAPRQAHTAHRGCAAASAGRRNAVVRDHDVLRCRGSV